MSAAAQRSVTVVAIGIGLAAAAASIDGLPPLDFAVLVTLSGGGALLAHGLGQLALRPLRSLPGMSAHRATLALVALVPVASIASGFGAMAVVVSTDDLSVVAVVLVSGATAGVLVALSHATDLDRSRQEALAARARQRAIDGARRELAEWVAHDLRVPLASVRAMVDALDDGPTTDDDADPPQQGTMSAEVDRLAGLVDDLVDLMAVEVTDDGAEAVVTVCDQCGEVHTERLDPAFDLAYRTVRLSDAASSQLEGSRSASVAKRAIPSAKVTSAENPR